MCSVEMLALVIAPLALGLTVAMAFMLPYGEIDVILAAGDALRAIVMLLPVPLIGWGILIPLTRADALNGR